MGSKIHRDTGRRIGEVSGKPSKLSNNANSYFISANKATGKQNMSLALVALLSLLFMREGME